MVRAQHRLANAEFYFFVFFKCSYSNFRLPFYLKSYGNFASLFENF